jgi:hypothetical protein
LSNRKIKKELQHTRWLPEINLFYIEDKMRRIILEEYKINNTKIEFSENLGIIIRE